MNREVHVRFWESPEVKLLRATRQRKMGSAIGHRERCGGHEIHSLWDRQHRRGVEHDLFGIAAAMAQYCEHPLAGAQTRHPIAGFDHLARGFEPRREREGGFT